VAAPVIGVCVGEKDSSRGGALFFGQNGGAGLGEEINFLRFIVVWGLFVIPLNCSKLPSSM
jgi:hypothetical protein